MFTIVVLKPLTFHSVSFLLIMDHVSLLCLSSILKNFFCVCVLDIVAANIVELLDVLVFLKRAPNKVPEEVNLFADCPVYFYAC